MPHSKESTGSRRTQGKDRHDAVDSFLTASRALVGVAVRSIEAADPAVTVPQHRLLVLLAARGPQSIGSLASTLKVNSSSVTRQCDRLERKDLVMRTRSETDGRAVVVSLTATGSQLVHQVTETRRADIAAILDKMQGRHIQDAVEALQHFNAAADEPEDGTWWDGAPR